ETVCAPLRPPPPPPPAHSPSTRAPAAAARHGYAIMRDVAERTDGRLRMSPGTLYGSIKRMLEQGLIEEVRERPPADEDDERRRYYRLSRFGRRTALAEAARLSALLKQARAHGLTPQRG